MRASARDGGVDDGDVARGVGCGDASSAVEGHRGGGDGVGRVAGRSDEQRRRRRRRRCERQRRGGGRCRGGCSRGRVPRRASAFAAGKPRGGCQRRRPRDLPRVFPRGGIAKEGDVRPVIADTGVGRRRRRDGRRCEGRRRRVGVAQASRRSEGDIFRGSSRFARGA